jgi:serine/threonine protein phosphatase PrpC
VSEPLYRSRPGGFDLQPASMPEAQRVRDFIHASHGLSNSYLVSTSEGRVVINTGMGFEAPRPYLPHTARLADAVRRSNEFIYGQAQKDPRQAGMGTTVVGVWIRERVVGVAHVGDSRAYLWRNEQLEPLTRDHSLMEAHIAAGLVEESKRLPAENQNMLVRVLGREPDVDVDVKEVPVRPGDYVLLCSDGLTRMVDEAELAKAIRRLQEPQRICDYLIAIANRNGGADNITVVVVQVTGSWWHRLLERWTRSARRGQDVETYAAV